MELDRDLSIEERTQQSRKLIGYAIGHDPEEIFIESGKPLPSRTASSVAATILKMYEENNGKTTHPEVSEVFRAGLRDVNYALHNHLSKHVQAGNLEFVYELADKKSTAEVMARLALRTEESLEGLLSLIERDSSEKIVYTDTRTSELKTVVPPTKHGGCPFAGHDGEIDISPLFYRFTSWSARVSIESLKDHFLKDR